MVAPGLSFGLGISIRKEKPPGFPGGSYHLFNSYPHKN
jgi:hypothetical protein